MITEQKIKEASGKIVRNFRPQKIILFGSWAWGKPGEDSDVDLFIIKDTPDMRIDRARKAREAVWHSGMPIDLVVYTPKEIRRRLALGDWFIKDILEKGKVLYGE